MRHHALFAYQMSVVIMLTGIQYIYTSTFLPNIFGRKYFTKSWVFVTNLLNDLSPSVYLDLYEPYI